MTKIQLCELDCASVKSLDVQKTTKVVGGNVLPPSEPSDIFFPSGPSTTDPVPTSTDPYGPYGDLPTSTGPYNPFPPRF